jgi:hypothetical protein
MTCTMDQSSTNTVDTVTKPSETCTEFTSTGTSFNVGSFVLSGGVVQAPPTPNTASAAVSSAIDRALCLAFDDDSDSSVDGEDIVCEKKAVFRKDLLKDDMSLFYNELAKLRVQDDDISDACSDEESDFDDEEEEDDISCFLGLEGTSSDVFDSFKRRYSGAIE